jgi:DNA-binding CsgD family transcriptional regulator
MWPLAAVPFRASAMRDVSLELKDPRVLRALQSVPAMQRWEILRRSPRPMGVPELAREARATVEDVRASIALLETAGLAVAAAGSNHGREPAYQAAMDRLFVLWDRNDSESAAAWRSIGKSMRDHSRQVVDLALDRPGSEHAMHRGGGSSMSVLLSDADALRLREAMLSIYSMLAEADTRARAGKSGDDVRPYHVATQLQHIDETPLPAAEFFVMESGVMARDRAALSAVVHLVLSPRELEVARLLEGGLSRPDIARKLGLSAHTVASVSKSIYRKLGVRNRAQLAARVRMA